MKTNIYSRVIARICCLFLLIGTSFPATSPADQSKPTFVLNSKESYLTWTGKKITGSHIGRVSIKSAAPIIEGSTLKGGDFVVDMESLVDEDLKDQALNSKLISHLKSEDFFNVAKFPVAELRLTSVEPIANAKVGEPNYTLHGNLTIIGVTNPISFPAIVNIGKSRATATTKIILDRTRWNLRYGSGKFFAGLGDKLIYDEFTVEVNIVGDLN